ncbi:MAG TPA: response regulator [Woeseiaceae bacterium]|nr:response regulator [Woeseiaceae bacterium]
MVQTARSSTPDSETAGKPKVLFVDDEKRVLNSMRALFRRDYELHLTTDGAEAIRIAEAEGVDVIIADQRMPGLCGVEVLGEVRQRVPSAVRILLTGYADLDAIEGSINIGEVFRFLSKPCPPQQLRETLAEAVQAARESGSAARAAALVEAPAPPPERREAPQPPAAVPPAAPTAAPAQDHAATVPNLALELEREEPPAPAPSAPPREEPADEVIVLSSEPDEPEEQAVLPASGAEEPEEEEEAIVLSSGAGEADEAAADEIVLGSEREPEFGDTIVIGDDSASGRSGACADMDRVGVALFTSDGAFAERVQQVLGERYRVTHASTLVQVTELLSDAGAGVLVTDFCTDGAMLRNMLSTLKRYLPQLITIVVSDERDATEMISLINHGQVFRYMSKPMDEARLVQNVNAAVLRHIQLLENPELAQRHSVVPDRPPRQAAALLAQFVNRVRGMRRLWVRS